MDSCSVINTAMDNLKQHHEQELIHCLAQRSELDERIKELKVILQTIKAIEEKDVNENA